MKIHPNTHTGPPLQDAIDAFAAVQLNRHNDRGGDWRVRLEMAARLEVPEDSILEKDVRYFIRRMGPLWLSLKVRGIGAATAEKLYNEAMRDDITDA